MRAKEDVRDIACDRNRPDRNVEQQVADHPRLQPSRRAELPRLRHQVQPDARRQDVTDDRDEPEQRVEPHLRAHARHLDRLIHQPRQCDQPLAGAALAFVSREVAGYFRNSGEIRLGRNSTTAGHTITRISTPNIGISMINTSFNVSTMRMPAIEQAIIRHNP